MILTKAMEMHIQTLVNITKAAFDSDITVGASSVGGPPEYDSFDWHIEMMNQGHLFTAIEEDTIIGGAILFGDESNEAFMYVGRIFISPDLFRKGYDIQLMEQIEAMNLYVDICELKNSNFVFQNNIKAAFFINFSDEFSIKKINNYHILKEKIATLICGYKATPIDKQFLNFINNFTKIVEFYDIFIQPNMNDFYEKFTIWLKE